MRSITATQKGLITGIAMVATSFLLFATKGNFESNLQYIAYVLYVAGIVWTLLDYSRQENRENKFGSYFSQGFKCFIVVTLLMVIFIIVFLKMHPEMKDQMAVSVKQDLVAQKNKTPKEIDDIVALEKSTYMQKNIMGTIFGYLFNGALITAIVSIVLLQKEKWLNKK